MLKSWEKKGESTILVRKYRKTFSLQRFVNPINREEIEFAMIDFTDWSVIMAITEDKKVIVTSQYRPGCNQISCSLPSGTADRNGEDKKSLIIRELEEETGYVAGEVIPLGVGYVHTSNSPTVSHQFLSLNCIPVGHKKENPNEEIEIELVPVQEWYRRVIDGEVDEPHSCLTTIRAMKYLSIKLDFSTRS